MYRKSILVVALILPLVPTALIAQEKMKTTPYYPLEVGNSWLYYSKTSTGGEATESTYRLTVTRHEELDGELCARVEMKINDRSVGYEHIRITEDGVYRHSFDGTKPKAPIRILKLPPKKGDSWQAKTEVLGETLEGKFTVGEEDVKILRKTYPAYSVTSEGLEVSGLEFKTTLYFSKDYGLIKQVIEVGKQTTVVELEKFDPAKK